MRYVKSIACVVALLAVGLGGTTVHADDQAQVRGGFAVVSGVGQQGGDMTTEQAESLRVDGVVTTADGTVWNYRLLKGENDIKALALAAWRRAGNHFVKLNPKHLFKDRWGEKLMEKGGSIAYDGLSIMYRDGILYFFKEAVYEELLKGNGLAIWDFLKDEGNALKRLFTDNPLKSVPGLVGTTVTGTLTLASELVSHTATGMFKGLYATSQFVYGAGKGTVGMAIAAAGLAAVTVEATGHAIYHSAMALYEGVVKGTLLYGHPDVTIVPGLLYIQNGVTWALVAGTNPSKNSLMVKLGLITVEGKEEDSVQASYQREGLIGTYQVSYMGAMDSQALGETDWEVLNGTIDRYLPNGDVVLSDADFKRLTRDVKREMNHKGKVNTSEVMNLMRHTHYQIHNVEGALAM